MSNFLKIIIHLLIFRFVFDVVGALLIDISANEKTLPKAVTFHFPEYAYKETSKNEIAYHEFEVACQYHIACENIDNVKKAACVRCCISYSCYQDIYAFDELEEGEIDVRLNSFKGCVIQRRNKKNRS